MCAKVVGVAYKKGVALLYIPLFLRGWWLKANSVQRYGGWLTRGGGLHERVRYIFILFFQSESGGTVLSTNWKDIEKQKTEVKAPDGMEYKKYEY